MNIINKLTLRHLRLNRNRTLITVLGIALSVAMVCAVAGFVASLRDIMRRQIVNYRGGEYHIAYNNVTPEDIENITAEGWFDSYYTVVFGEGEEWGYTSLYLHLAKPDRNYKKIAASLAEKYGFSGYGLNSELLALDGVIAEDNVLMMFITIAVILVVIITGGSVTVIANAFNISASERVRQFGLLKSAGATGRQIRRSVLFEALVLTAAAIPAGIALGFALQAAGVAILNTFIGDSLYEGFKFHVVFAWFIPVAAAGVAVVTVLLSAWRPARRAAKTPAIDAIRLAKEVRARGGTLKTSRLTQKLFGFEGTLAAKSLKRSRGKYRSAVVSLTVSVVLFITVSSFVTMLNKATEMDLGGFDCDAIVFSSEDVEAQDSIEKAIAAWPGAAYKAVRNINLGTTAPDAFFSRRADEIFGRPNDNRVYLSLISVSERDFETIAPAARGAGILVTAPSVTRYENKLVEYSRFNFIQDLTLTLEAMYGDSQETAEMTLTAEARKYPDFLPRQSLNGMAAVLIPETDFFELASKFTGGGSERNINTHFYVYVADSDKFAAAMRETYYASALDLQDMRRKNQSLMLVVSLFGYGFIILLSAIAVTSVVATISTNMALRRQEFAMLYSAGMTAKGMDKMLNLESVLYGVKSLVIGLPAGTAVSVGIWYALRGTAVFAYPFPWAAMVIAAAAVILLTFSTMRYGRRKLRGVSIVEAIRDEVM